MTALMLAYLAGMIALLMINRTHLVIKHLFFRQKKVNNDAPTTHNINSQT